MARVLTNYYQAIPTYQTVGVNTGFMWATTDNDLFNRALDLYNLAQAVELHTHEDGKGLPVGRVVDGLLHEGSYAYNSIPSTAYKDLSITNAKIADRTIEDVKMVYDPVHKSGDTMVGDLRVNQVGGPAANIWFGNDLRPVGCRLNYDSQTFWLYNPNPAASFRVQGDIWVMRLTTPDQGYIYFGQGGSHWMGVDPTGHLLYDNHEVYHTGNYTPPSGGGGTLVDVPLGGTIMINNGTQSNTAIATGHWQYDTDANGRLIVGAGVDSGGGHGPGPGGAWVAGQQYATTWWTPTTGMVITPTSGGQAGSGAGGPNPSTISWTGPYTGTWYPPTYTMNLLRRI